MVLAYPALRNDPVGPWVASTFQFWAAASRRDDDSGSGKLDPRSLALHYLVDTYTSEPVDPPADHSRIRQRSFNSTSC